MTTTSIGPVDEYAWLYKLQYAASSHYRWADAASAVTIAGDGVYTSPHPVVEVRGLGSSGPRIETRQISLSLYDPDSTYKTQFSTPDWYLSLIHI